MDTGTVELEKYRAWVFDRQGLAGGRYSSAREALSRAGWQRSVGGANPYLAIRARSGEDRTQVERLAMDLQLFELPSARGCTYVLPAEHFALGLAIGRNCDASDLAMARKLGVEDAEIESLKQDVSAALAAGPLAPADLKKSLGDRVRNLGDEGKRRGMITTLPLVLGLLQTEGKIRRKPANGRLDTQRYAYELWTPSLGDLPDDEAAATEIARLFFTWIGAATLKEFAAYTAISLKTAQAACGCAGIAAFGHDRELLALPRAWEEFQAYEPPARPVYRLVGNLDSLLILRRGTSFWLDNADGPRLAPTDKGLNQVSGFSELWSHAILDRGKLVGLWEFDADDGTMAWWSWIPVDESLRAQIEETERYVREDLGDARSFSLDSPASRRPRLDALRALQNAS